MKEKGFSLIEMLVSMLISIVLTQQIYVFVKSLYASQNLLQEMLEYNEGRQVSLLMFKNFLNQAGYKDDNNQSAEKIFDKKGIFPTGVFIFGENDKSNISSSKASSDAIHIRFQAPKYGEFRDCKNTILEAGKVHMMSFYIDKNSDFRCLGAPNNKNKRSSAVLAHKIRDLQIEYAYRNLNSIVFCDAKCISKLNKWQEVVAVRFLIGPLICLKPMKKCNLESKDLQTRHVFELKNLNL